MSVVRGFWDWLTVKDYLAAKKLAAKKTVARYSRGNVSVQNGLFLDDAGLKKLSALGDQAMANLKRKAFNL